MKFSMRSSFLALTLFLLAIGNAVQAQPVAIRDLFAYLNGISLHYLFAGRAG